MMVMNNRVAVRQCREYDFQEVYNKISDIYRTCGGPDVKNKKVLVKPNILTDSDPIKCVTTHPVVVEAMIRFLQDGGASVFVGDSPGIHLWGFKSEKSGIYNVCLKTGAVWVDFIKNGTDKKIGGRKVKIASAVDEVDLIISLPKFKTHQLVYFTGAIKNTFGLIPGFSKAKQHALNQDRYKFSAFLVELNEVVSPHFFLMDGIMGMEGPGPGQGFPVRTEVLIGSTNPVALDIIASTIAGYDPMSIPTNSIAVEKGSWLKNPGEIIYDGPVIETIIKKDFKRIPITDRKKNAVNFVMKRIKSIRWLQNGPVFIHKKCTGCLACIEICPEDALAMHSKRKNWVLLTDKKCIRCFCCSEVCQDNAIEVRRKFFGSGILLRTYSVIRRLS